MGNENLLIKYSNRIIVPDILTAESVFFVQQETNSTNMATKILPMVSDTAENPICYHAVQTGLRFTSALSEWIFLINAFTFVNPEKEQIMNVTNTKAKLMIRANKTTPINFARLLPFLPIRQVAGICSIPRSLSPAKAEDTAPIKINARTKGNTKL